MATATQYFRGTTRADDPVGDQCIVFPDVGWRGYRAMLQLRGERPRPRLVYLDGCVYLVTTSYFHEFLKKRFGRFVEAVAEELRIPYRAAGETTLRRRKKKGGVEGDETYYFTNQAALLGKREIDLQVDPPPDLAIEVVHTHGADAAIEVYRRFGVPELWLWEDQGVRILVRQPDGRYAESSTSLSILSLTATEIAEWVGRPEGDSELDWILALRAWIRDVLLPRSRNQIPEEPPT